MDDVKGFVLFIRHVDARWIGIAIFDSGSFEKDSPLEIIAMKEEEETGFVHDLRLGKGQRHAHKTGQPLAQRIIPTLDMGGSPVSRAHGCMLLFRNNRSINFQKVGEAMAESILLRNRLPQPLACLVAPVPNGISHHLSCLAAQSYPNPAVVRFFGNCTLREGYNIARPVVFATSTACSCHDNAV